MKHDPLDWIPAELERLESARLRRVPRIRQSCQAAHIEFDGRTVVNFGSNDYLGFASHPELARAASESLRQGGWGSGASPLITGKTATHAALERAVAEFERVEDALLFSTGFAANAGTIPALVGPEDVVLSDAKNHASIIDGCRLSRAHVEIYRHADVDDVRRKLVAASSHRRRLIVTDSLFSMDGDLAPLPELAELAWQYDAMLMIDEAHATGVLGRFGRGVAELTNTEEAIAVRVGTFSKGLGGLGGFVAGSRPLIAWLTNRARPYVFSTSLPEAACAASLAALTLVRDEPERRETLLTRATQLRQRLLAAGWSLDAAATQILRITLGSPVRALELSSRLWQAGCFVPAIRPPTVPEGESCLRISLSYSHTQADLDRLVDALGTRLLE